MSAQFVLRNLVQLGANLYTVQVYLVDVSNVSSYQLEIAVTGMPTGVGYSYQSAPVTGMLVDVTPGAVAIAGFASGLGASFDVNGALIGTVTVNFDKAPTSAFSLEIASPELLSTTYQPIAFGSTGIDVNTATTEINLLAYSWKSHTLLEGVHVVGTSDTTQTDAAGAASFITDAGTSVSLAANRAVPAPEASATASAVNLQDAIAILKMIVGLDVNGAGKPLSPYQSLAADFDGNGQVQLTDAIGVLKHVVGLSAPDPTWHFVSELDPSIPGKTNLNPGAAATSISVDISGGSSVHAGLVGYLSGDVDGSFAGASGSSSLSGSYFTTLLAANPEFNSSQFGIYA